jgi:hypothetical protein
MPVCGGIYLVNIDKPCFVCGTRSFAASSKDYMRCISCGHELNIHYEDQQFIIDEVLSKDNVCKIGLYDNFKLQLLKKCAAKKDFLLDIGTGSGKFLYHSKSLFKNYSGVEVTDACVEFARNSLGLKIEKEMSAVNDTISVATFWHSLEHMPIENIAQTLNHINHKSSFDTRIIITVPNNDSLQYLMFGERFAYYDPASHIHQFSLYSLDKLMEKYKFVKEESFYSFFYACFGYLQGFMNVVFPAHNYLYYRIKRRTSFGKKRAALLFYDAHNFILVMLFLIPALLFCVYDFIYRKRGGVITACYRKKKD